MNNRPIQHQLETKSRIAFELSLPATWVYRTVNPDYGLDGLVEIFTEGGMTTGNFFFVQLKSTGIENINNALTIRLPHEKCEYYETLAIPLLIVSYHEPTDRLFAKWFKFPSAKVRSRNKKFISIILNGSDEWLIARCSSIVSDLEFFRKHLRLAVREERMAQYYEAKSKMNLSAKPTIEDIEPTIDFNSGEEVFHDAFGRGIVDEVTDYYFFVKFDDDDMLRKFEPGDSRYFVKLINAV